DRDRLRQHLAVLPRPAPTLLLLSPAYQSVLLHRLSFFLCARGHRLLARIFWHLNLLVTACDISPLADVGGGLLIHFPLSVALFGKIGRNCTVQGHVAVGGGTSRTDDIGGGPGLPVIGDNVVLGWGSMVVGPVRVGDRVVVGHGVVVTTNVPDDC